MSSVIEKGLLIPNCTSLVDQYIDGLNLDLILTNFWRLNIVGEVGSGVSLLGTTPVQALRHLYTAWPLWDGWSVVLQCLSWFPAPSQASKQENPFPWIEDKTPNKPALSIFFPLRYVIVTKTTITNPKHQHSTQCWVFS